MFNRQKSLTLATALLTVIPLLTDSVRVGFPQADAQTPKTENMTAEADKLFQLGVQQYHTGLYPQALQTYGRALELYKQQNNEAGIAKTLNNLGEVYLGLELDEKAMSVLQPALVLRRKLKDRAGEGETLDNIGGAYLLQEQYDQALANLQQALAIRREVKEQTGEAKTLSQIGAVYDVGFKQYTKALETLNQARKIQQAAGDKFQAVLTLKRIIGVYISLRDNPRALESGQLALSLNRELKNRAQEGEIGALIAIIYVQQNQYDQALQLDQQAQSIVRESGNRSREVIILRKISIIYSLQHKIDSALEFGQQALVLAQSNLLRRQQMYSLNWLGRTYLYRVSINQFKGNYQLVKSDSTRSLEFLQQALTLARELKIRRAEADNLQKIGEGYGNLKEYQKAIEVLQQSASIARVIKDLDVESNVLTSLSVIYTDQGDKRKGIEINLRIIEIYREQKNKFLEANNLIGLGNRYNTIGEYQKAVEAYEQARATARQIEISKLAANLQDDAISIEYQVLDGLSDSYGDLGQIYKALNFAQQALKYAQTIRKPDLEVKALLRLSFLYTNTFHDFPQAIAYSQQALTIAKQIKEPQLEAEALDDLSYAYNQQRNQPKALEYATQELEIAKRLKNALSERSALDQLISIYENQGNYQKVLELAQQQLALVQKAKLGDFETLAFINLSRGYRLTGDTTKAVETAKQAINLAKKLHNPKDEALAILYLSRAYKVRGEYNLGIQAAQSALQFSHASKDFGLEVAATSIISEIDEALGEYQKVIAVAQPALTQAKKIGDRIQEAQLILNLGNAYRVIGDYPKAKELIEQGLQIARELKNPRLESIALNSLGSYYNSLNDYQKALSLAQQSLKIAEDLKSPPLTIYPQFALGDIYSRLGDYKKSREFYQQALTTAQQLKNRNSEGIALLTQAYTYFAQGEPQKTVELSKLALTIFEEIKVPRLQAFAHRMLSVGYGELGNDAQAMQEAQNFLTFARKTQNSLWEKSALSLIGGLHEKFGRKEQAIATYQQALAITTDNQILGADAYILAGLARIYRNLNQPNIAIKYYKDSINKIEEIRHGIEGLPPELQKSFLDATIDFNRVKISDIYRQLAELLLSEGRNKEALYVQELLRGQEIRDFISTGRGATNKPQISLTPTEKKVPTFSQPLIALGNQIIACERLHPQQCVELKNQQGKLIDQYSQQLKVHDKEIRENRQKDGTFFDPSSLGKIREIVEAQPDTVMIYPLVTEKELIIQLYAQGDVVKTIPVPVGRKELGNAVYQFRQLMEDCEKPGTHCGTAEIPQVQAASQKLYTWLMKPIEAELKGSSVKNLVFALDRVIRYVPMSALYDGKKYLIEKYTIYIAPSAELTDTKEKLPTGTQNSPVLAMGLSERLPEPHRDFPALHNVPKELDAIVRKNATDQQGIYPGDKYLNHNFDFDTLRDNLKGHKILHLATHGVFDAKSANKSYILSGTGEELTPDYINRLTGLSDIHLVVLSACQTALAGPDQQDGVEINTFASNFLKNSAKSVIASLWQVNDSSTAQLMENFYRDLAYSKTPITKAQALRLAQLSLLYGKQVTLDDIQRGGINVEPVPGKQTSTRSSVSHPYYWAPFILMGNGL